MQAVWAALPEFDPERLYPVPAPMRRPGDLAVFETFHIIIKCFFKPGLSGHYQALGGGPRRECEGRILDGQVQINGSVHDDPDEDIPPEGLELDIQGRRWPYHAKALLLLNKPAAVPKNQQNLLQPLLR